MKQLIFILFFPVMAISQDCKISKQFDEMKNKTTYLPKEMGETHIRLAKVIHSELGTDTIYMAIITINSASSNYRASGYFVKFDDGTVFKDQKVDVECEFQDLYDYRMQAYVRVSSEMRKCLLTKKVVKVQLDIYEQAIPDSESIKIQSQSICMQNTW